jgi:hypothetical protein
MHFRTFFSITSRRLPNPASVPVPVLVPVEPRPATTPHGSAFTLDPLPRTFKTALQPLAAGTGDGDRRPPLLLAPRSPTANEGKASLEMRVRLIMYQIANSFRGTYPISQLFLDGSK